MNSFMETFTPDYSSRLINEPGLSGFSIIH